MRPGTVLLAGALLALGPAFLMSPASADDSKLTISHVEPAGAEVKILLSVPKGAEVDLNQVAVSIQSAPADAQAILAGEGKQNQVRRTTIVVIDTSDSMKGERFAAAQTAAKTFLANVPDDVYVGIVAFDRQVTTALPPSRDRAAATHVIDGLTLARGTRLNDGMISAVKLAGTDGQRSIVILSDGLNTSGAPLTDVEAAISKAGIKVDAVALDQSRADQGPLRVMTSAGAGQVVPADPKALTQAFTEEADSLARQILVTAKVPAAVSAAEATIVVTAQSAAGTLRAESYSVIRGSSTIVPTAPGTPEASGIQIPKEAMYGGLAALGVGLLVLISSVMVAGTQGSLPKTVEQRIADYGSTGVVSTPGAAKAESRGSSLDQAKGAAASMLRHNRGLEARIEQRLEAAGSALKPAEWLLMHATIALICGLVGTLLLGNDFLSVLLFIGAGLLLPWLWLGHRRKRRIRAFNSGLADTLQLISGSLTAGMSFAQSLDSVVAEGHEPIAGEFKRVLVETRLGVPLEAALEGIAQRLESKDFAWVVMAIRIQRDVGGNLAELLNTVAGTLRERDYLRRQVKSLSAEGLLSAYILIALPICMLGYMLSFRRSYIMPMFTDPMGLMMLAVAVVLLLLGWFMMSRIVKVEI